MTTQRRRLSPQNGHLLDSQGVADLLGMSKYWVVQQRRVGGGPPYISLTGKIGSQVGRRAVRYRLEDVEAWLEEQVHDASSK